MLILTNDVKQHGATPVCKNNRRSLSFLLRFSDNWLALHSTTHHQMQTEPSFLLWKMDRSSCSAMYRCGRDCIDANLEPRTCWAAIQPSKLFPSLQSEDITRSFEMMVVKPMAHSRSPFWLSLLVSNNLLAIQSSVLTYGVTSTPNPEEVMIYLIPISSLFPELLQCFISFPSF